MKGKNPGSLEERNPELLAPAGSKEALYAAIAAGADAVYLGGQRFGARHFAANFSREEMEEAVRYAHLRSIPVYVTVNTLVHDEELPSVMEYLLALYAMGADAVLIQDMGLLVLSRELIPGLALHASTQCTISTREGAVWVKHAGFSRVVLARETPLAEIDRIMDLPPCDRPGIEIFIHGALCYSYSGQCLLSSLIGRRSGNRGMCAQPCRKPYRLVHGMPDVYSRLTEMEEVPCTEEYLLSTKDLCTYWGLPDIVERKVDALKIEGRMRSPEYVAAVVSAYRIALDALKRGCRCVSSEDEDAMAAAFNRGFSRGYLLGDRGHALMGRERPDNRGLLIGKVVPSRTHSGGILVRPSTAYLPVAGDGILIEDPTGKDRRGCALHADAVRNGKDLFIPLEQKGIAPGSAVYLTKSMQLMKKLKEILRGGSKKPGIPVRMKVRIAPGEPLQGSVVCTGAGGLSIRAEFHSSFIVGKAEKNPLTRDAILRQMRKAGDTSWRVEDVDLDFNDDPFIPLGMLNEFRRELLSALREKWLGAFLPRRQDLEAADSRVRGFARDYLRKKSKTEGELPLGIHPVLTVYCGTPDELAAACMAGCDAVCYEPSCAVWDDLFQEIVEGSQYCREQQVSFSWKWPRITGGPFLEKALPAIPALFSAGVTGIMVEEAGMAEAILSREPRMHILAGYGLNITNACAVRALPESMAICTLSPELSSQQIATLIALSARECPRMRYEIVCQGNLDAMVSEDTLLSTLAGDGGYREGTRFGLLDGTGRIFPVYEDREGRTHILNAMETCLIDRIPDLLAMGVTSLAIDARTRGHAYAREMTSLYRDGLETASGGDRDAYPGTRFRELARRLARGGITASHFNRGVAGYGDTGEE